MFSWKSFIVLLFTFGFIICLVLIFVYGESRKYSFEPSDFYNTVEWG